MHMCNEHVKREEVELDGCPEHVETMSQPLDWPLEQHSKTQNRFNNKTHPTYGLRHIDVFTTLVHVCEANICARVSDHQLYAFPQLCHLCWCVSLARMVLGRHAGCPNMDQWLLMWIRIQHKIISTVRCVA